MPRGVRKARVEGAAKGAPPVEGLQEAAAAFKARCVPFAEQPRSDPTADYVEFWGSVSDMLSEAVYQFKERFPDDWEALRLCPLQHGLETMVEKLSA